MSSKDKIEIEELRKVVNLLLDRLRDGGIQQVTLGEDFYWEMDAERLYDVTKDPADLSIGSLFDDWESVQKVANGQSEPVILLLLKVAPLLRYLGGVGFDSELAGPAK